MRARRSAYSLMLALLCAAVPAYAADGPRPEATAPPIARDRADDVFRQGLAAYDAGRMEEAERHFRQAWELKKTHDIAGNLGVVELLRGKPRDAAEHIAWALKHMPPTESAKMRKGLDGELQKARLQVGAIRVQTSVPGASVYVNGKPVGTAPLDGEVFVDPGNVTIEARLAGYQDARSVVQIDKGASRDVSLPLSAVEEKRRSIVPAVVMGGIGGVVAVTGAVLMGLGASKRSDARSLAVQTSHSCVVHDPAPQGACAQLASEATQADRLWNGGLVAFAVAGAAAVGATAYALWPAPRRDAGSARSLRVVPLASANGGGVVFSGSF